MAAAAELRDLLAQYAQGSFDAEARAEEFFVRFPEHRAEERIAQLAQLKERTEKELRREVCANYRGFIHAAGEIRAIEAQTGQLKQQLRGLERAVRALRACSLEGDYDPEQSSSSDEDEDVGPPPPPDVDADADADADAHQQDRLVRADELVREYQTAAAVALLCELRDAGCADPRLPALTEELAARLTRALKRDGRHSLTYNRDLAFLVRLGRPLDASSVFLTGSSQRVRSALRQAARGDMLAHVSALSASFFDALVTESVEYVALFREENRSLMSFVLKWAVAEVETFGLLLREILRCTETDISSRLSLAQEGARGATDEAALAEVLLSTVACVRQLFADCQRLHDKGLPLGVFLARTLEGSFASLIRDGLDRSRVELLSAARHDDWLPEPVPPMWLAGSAEAAPGELCQTASGQRALQVLWRWSALAGEFDTLPFGMAHSVREALTGTLAQILNAYVHTARAMVSRGGGGAAAEDCFLPAAALALFGGAIAPWVETTFMGDALRPVCEKADAALDAAVPPTVARVVRKLVGDTLDWRPAEYAAVSSAPRAPSGPALAVASELRALRAALQRRFQPARAADLFAKVAAGVVGALAAADAPPEPLDPKAVTQLVLDVRLIAAAIDGATDFAPATALCEAEVERCCEMLQMPREEVMKPDEWFDGVVASSVSEEG